MTEKFEFIDAEYAAYQESEQEHVPSIVKMCIWMEVSRSGFYEWRNAPESATAKRRGILALYVQKSFEDSDDTYGYRRVHTDLVAWGVPAGPELVRSLMRELGLEPCQPQPWRVSLTEGDGQEHDIPDLVARDFTADAPGQKMVGDITYISTWEGARSSAPSRCGCQALPPGPGCVLDQARPPPRAGQSRQPPYLSLRLLRPYQAPPRLQPAGHPRSLSS